MKPAQIDRIRYVMEKCYSLDDADTALGKLDFKPKLTTAQRWGLWDGYAARPSTTGGLGNFLSEETTKEYNDAYELGVMIRKGEV